jgi:putative transposase
LHNFGSYQSCVESQKNLDIMRMLDEQYFKTPFYGVRRFNPYFAVALSCKTQWQV